MMKTTELRRIAILLVILVVSYVVIRIFMIEVFALGWHIRHGTKADLQSFNGKKYEVDVPMLALAQLDDDGKGVSIIRRRGQIRAFGRQPEWAMMTFSVDQQVLTAEDLRRVAPIIKKRGMTISEIDSLVVAGQELHCFQQTLKSNTSKQVVPEFPMIDLKCVTQADKRGLSASYTGTRGLIPEFYSVLKAVKLVQN